MQKFIDLPLLYSLLLGTIHQLQLGQRCRCFYYAKPPMKISLCMQAVLRRVQLQMQRSYLLAWQVVARRNLQLRESAKRVHRRISQRQMRAICSSWKTCTVMAKQHRTLVHTATSFCTSKVWNLAALTLITELACIETTR